MIVSSFGPPISAHDHERASGTRRLRAAGYVPGRVLHLVTDALPTTSAGYTIRTHEIALAQREAGLDPHVATTTGYPVTQGRIDGRRLVELDGVPYHRLLPWRMPDGPSAGPSAAPSQRGLELADGLTRQLRPAVLHAASNYANARLALALRERYGLPVVYEVRGFWEDTWLSRYPDAAERATSELYQRNRELETQCMLAADLVVTREAEMAKLLENTYRHVNIALVNEMAIFCRELGIDLHDAIRCAATKPFGFQPFYPGPGVGGHCIPIDPNYLSYKVRTLGYPFRFVELAQEINGRMPGYVTERAAELLNRNAQPVNGARVLLLGVTYKKDIADQRESPARPIARKLRGRGPGSRSSSRPFRGPRGDAGPGRFSPPVRP